MSQINFLRYSSTGQDTALSTGMISSIQSAKMLRCGFSTRMLFPQKDPVLVSKPPFTPFSPMQKTERFRLIVRFLLCHFVIVRNDAGRSVVCPK